MRLISIKSVIPGNKLASPVRTYSGKIILNEGMTLTESYIKRLKQSGVYKVYIHDERFDDVKIEDSIDLNVRNEVSGVLKDVYNSVHSGRRIDEYLVKASAGKLVDYVRSFKEKGVSILSTDAVDEYILEHSINVAILTAFMGNRMTYNYNQLCDLVVGALIHDIGRENIREESPEHISKGFDVMRKYKGLSLHSSIVCYEHHENFDGSGYPRKLTGSAISEFTRIIRVADYYDYVLHGYDNDNIPVMPHQAFEYLLAVSGKILDFNFVEVFRDTIVFYPNGCTVSLSNGLKGVVVKQNLGSPQRPVVRVFNDTGILGEVDLFKSLSLFIKDVHVI